MIAKDIMSTPVVGVAPGTPVAHVAALLAIHRISGVPVLSRGRLVGVVNEMDLLHRHEIGTEHTSESSAWYERLFRVDPAPSLYVKSHATRASDVMSHAVPSVREDAPIRKIVALFDARTVRRVCVIRERKVVGVVTRADVVRVVAEKATPPERGRPLSDREIYSKLLAELTRQRWWRPQWSTLTVEAGVVRFRGVIDAPEEKAAARVAAEGIPGVRAVEDLRTRMADLPHSL